MKARQIERDTAAHWAIRFYGRHGFHLVAESFFASLKTERIRRKIYKTRQEARQDLFGYFELFNNPKRRHSKNGMLSPAEFEMAAQ